jgi:hypothetical protein
MKTSILFLALSVALIIAGCDLGVNPLLFDGTPITAKFRVDQTGTVYASAKVINLQDALGSISKEIDSVKVFNITLQIDSLTNGTDPSTTLTGVAVLDLDTLFTVNNVALSAFSSERSIFDKSLTGFSYKASGVSHLIALLHQNPLPTVSVGVLGTASNGNLHFTTKLKLYTQVYTTP